MKDMRRWLADGLMRAATARIRRSHPDWARAMLSEHASLSDRHDQLGWAFGSLRASLAIGNAVYPAVLALAVAGMGCYQWSADESLITLLVLSSLALLLGVLRPRRFLLSGVAVGVVVCAVNSFETASGVRPAYEVYHHTWGHNLRWLALLAPALLCSLLGRCISLKLLTPSPKDL